MTYANQFDYVDDAEPELSDYQDDPAFTDFAKYVTLELLEGRDWKT